MKKVLLTACMALAGMSAAQAGVIDAAQRADNTPQSWSAWGGDIGFNWNRDLTTAIGITLKKASEQTAKQDVRNNEWFNVRESGGLQFSVVNNALQAITGGSVQMRGGYTLALRDGSTLDMSNMTLRPRSSDARSLDIVTSDGKVWFYSDHVMFRLKDDGRTLQIETADIRVTPELADRLGAPEAANWSLGTLQMNTQVYIQGTGSPQDACNQSSPTYPWPGNAVTGVSGATYEADLFMETFDAQFMRCQGCDGPGGTDGLMVFAPDSSLINNVNNGTAVATIAGDPLGTSTALYTGNIAWNEMFSGSAPNYNQPYKNDQHPFLIWNLYRYNADGSIEQIGRSGVKHAFLTVNFNCLGTCYDGNSNGRGCQDTYATGNNDSSGDLGPRSEIIPASGTWGRCGSIWDPNCTGSQHSNGNDSYAQRLKTHESQIDPAANAGATYKFESWYIARDDINIYNSMATLSVTPHYNSGSHSWSLANQTAYRLGPAIDRWVDPTTPGANALNTELSNTEGHAKVAVKATDNGNGTWTYTYAVMNLDYARGVTQQAPAGGGPDPRVLSNKGFDSFSVPVPAGSVVTGLVFRDGDTDATNNWTGRVANGNVVWSAGDRLSPIGNNRGKTGNTLDWGTLYSFSVTVNHGPTSGSSSLHVATAGSPSAFSVATLVPGS
jgi:hypothetical protein